MKRALVLLPLLCAGVACPKAEQQAAAPSSSAAEPAQPEAVAPQPGAPASAPGVAVAHSHEDAWKDGQVVVRERDYMSTYVTISVAAEETPEVEAAIKAAFAEVERQAALLSEWREDSEISAVNRQAGKAAVKVGAELFDVIDAALQVSADTGGAFDVTFQAIGGLWDFKSLKPEVPKAEAIAERVALIDYKQVELDKAARSVKLLKPGMKMGLGGIAKGYIVDGASAVLKAKGFPNHLVTAGGDLYASGRRGDRKWRIGVRDPKDRRVMGAMELQDEGVATSGNYEKFFVKDGVRYHHILDPKTGMPARGLSSVTIIAKSAMLADAYATAVFVLGKDRGMAAAKRQGLEVLMFDEAHKQHATEGIAGRVHPLPEDAAERR